MNKSKSFGWTGENSTSIFVTENFHPLLQPKNQGKSFKCRFCRKSFAYRRSLIIHERIHTDERPYECQFCSHRFRQSSNLQVHLRIHTGERPYKCHICHHQFNQSSNLKTHLKTHVQGQIIWEKISSAEVHKSKLFESSGDDAGKKDKTSSTVPKAGPKSWRCVYCQAIFQQRSKLEEHERIHTGEKPFQCPFCDHRSSQKVNLNKHLMVHTGEKPFKCTLCPFRATQKSHLVVHQRIHLKKKILEHVLKLSSPQDFLLSRSCDGMFHPQLL